MRVWLLLVDGKDIGTQTALFASLDGAQAEALRRAQQHWDDSEYDCDRPAAYEDITDMETEDPEYFWHQIRRELVNP